MSTINVTPQIKLKPIVPADQSVLMELMWHIYPPAYGHYWKDNCSWYLNSQYGQENLKKELLEENSSYYFVQLPSEPRSEEAQIMGILRICAQKSYVPIPDKKAFKVHRLYLAPAAQHKGIGRALMNYAETTARNLEHDLLWLDAMDTHEQAQQFYKRLGFQRTQLRHLPFPLLKDEHRPIWYMHKML